MDLESPRPITTVRRNPPRRAKQMPSINAPDFSATSASVPAATTSASDPDASATATTSASVPPAAAAGGSENLKVFLRIRPLEIRSKPTKNPKAKPRGKPQAPSPKCSKRKNNNNVCLVVNDSSSVTLSAPPSVFDGKRTKSELYDGFSFVFPQESAQEDIYERVMNPLVLDFIGGKSSLLAAMGPTGSGKTHTMFGSAREPGIVPLALRRIFGHAMESASHQQSRAYYLSMFEIYSERGKGERIFDLSLDGGDLSFQQSTIKGLQEIRVSDANEAESLVARGLLKRATAATSSNSQSSRSQCIINIRCTLEDVCDNDDSSAHGAVLTVADLAGAEREGKTGNQGARLVESNFINNTSMVFGLCLRSLLEHQKNPKKLFEKHFKNSLLTRYLRDYLEGKRRMTLVLTVKPGEYDYLDTSFLLRQASPYMKIKFNNVDDVPNLRPMKRNTTLSFRTEDQKRKKSNNSKAEVIDCEKSPIDMPSRLGQGACSEKLREIDEQYSSSMPKAVHDDAKLNKELEVELAGLKRNDEVMRKFSKALWSVLKQYKDRLEESENEVRNLKAALGKEISQVAELTNELKELRSHCSCYKHPSSRQTCGLKTDALLPNSASELVLSSSDHVNSRSNVAELICNLTPTPSCQSPEISSVPVNESAIAGLKGILFDAELAGDSKSEFRNQPGRRSFVLERQKFLAYDAVYSSFPSGGFDGQNHHQKAESVSDAEHFFKHLDQSGMKVPFDFDSARLETAYEDVASHSVLDDTANNCPSTGQHILSKEDEKLETSDAAGSASNVEDFNGPWHEVENSPGNGYRNEVLVEIDSHGVRGTSCSGGIEQSDVFATSNQMEEGTSNMSSSDGDGNLLLEKADGSNAVCLVLYLENNTDQIYQRVESLHEFKHRPEDVEGIEDGQKESSQNANLIDETGRGMVHKCESNMEVVKTGLDMPLVEDVNENDGSQSREHMKNERHVSSTKMPKAVKPKRKLLPASTLLLKEFSGLDMEADNAKECKSKPTPAGRGRSQGSMSLVHLLTGKQ